MRIRTTTTLAGLLALSLAGCTGSHGSSGSGFASTAAPATSQSTTTPGSTSPGSMPAPGPIDYTGVWELSGTDASRGAYHGTASVAAVSSGLSVQRLVTYATPAASGRQVASAWNATGAQDPSGLWLHAHLRRAHVIKRLGQQVRLANDARPLDVDALLSPPSGAPVTSTGPGAVFHVAFPALGLDETWVRSGAGATLFPTTDVTSVPLHAPPTAGEKNMLFSFFAKYWTLPSIAPYTSRPDFQAAIHTVPVDHSARDWYRTLGPSTVVVQDGVVDDFSVTEETWRADAFGRTLHEKAASFDQDMEANHLDPCGMVVYRDGATIYPSGDGALHLGCWVASQVYRFQATGDAQALKNVETGIQALATLVDICPDKTTFARAIQTTATPPQNWTQGTGAYAGLAWLPGGNNDMLHGIEYGFLAAEQILPSGHPLRAVMATQAKSLLDNCKLAQSGTHQVFLASVSWKTSGDPAEQARYKSALHGNLKDRVWTAAGDGIMNEQGIADWSGHHLGQVTFCGLRILGGANPDSDEQGWRGVGASGASAAFGNMRPAREGLLATIAGAFGVQGGGDDAKDVLAEIACPKPAGDADISRDVSVEYSVSPYPSLPWKNDWMSNPGRVQAISGIPLFYRGSDENYWARGALPTGGSVSSVVPTSQDYLHAYWLGRVSGLIAPTD